MGRVCFFFLGAGDVGTSARGHANANGRSSGRIEPTEPLQRRVADAAAEHPAGPPPTSTIRQPLLQPKQLLRRPRRRGRRGRSRRRLGRFGRLVPTGAAG